MTELELLMPSLGESVMEGTVLSWLKKEGDAIEEEESILEVATDKVDTEIPSIYGGTIKKILIREGEVAQVGKPLAIIEVEHVPDSEEDHDLDSFTLPENGSPNKVENTPKRDAIEGYSSIVARSESIVLNNGGERFYSPLVKKIAYEEGISQEELDQLHGSGREGRVTKNDILAYLPNRIKKRINGTHGHIKSQPIDYDPERDEVVEMDRMRKIIAQRMIESQQISAHVTSFIEADVTNIIAWRKSKKQYFKDQFNVPLSINAIIMDAIAQTLKEFPVLNASVDGDNIIYRKDINLGMAVALSDGNLIVPVVKNADQLGIKGIAAKTFDLAQKARNNELTAEDLKGGTYTVSNIGSFSNVMGTPMILQPQVAIMAVGTAEKKPAVIETDEGDIIGIRQKMFLSHAYDHRIIDGAVGGSFVKSVADKLSNFDTTREE